MNQIKSKRTHIEKILSKSLESLEKIDIEEKIVVQNQNKAEKIKIGKIRQLIENRIDLEELKNNLENFDIDEDNDNM